MFKVLLVEIEFHLIREKRVSKVRKFILFGDKLKRKYFILFRDECRHVVFVYSFIYSLINHNPKHHISR